MQALRQQKPENNHRSEQKGGKLLRRDPGPKHRKTLPFYETRKRTILCTREEQPPTEHHQTNPREYKPKAVEYLV